MALHDDDRHFDIIASYRRAGDELKAISRIEGACIQCRLDANRTFVSRCRELQRVVQYEIANALTDNCGIDVNGHDGTWRSLAEADDDLI